MTMPVSLQGLIDAGPIVGFWAALFCLLSNIRVRGPVQRGSRYSKCISVTGCRRLGYAMKDGL